jgi:hypothetical protein
MTSADSGGPVIGAPLLMQLYISHDAPVIGANLTVQRGMGRPSPAAGAPVASVVQMQVLPGPAVFPPDVPTPIMVGEPLVLRTDAIPGNVITVVVMGVIVAVGGSDE